MRIHNLYTDASGQSHFRDIEVEWVEETRSGKLSKRLPATGIIFREVPPTYDLDWHPAIVSSWPPTEREHRRHSREAGIHLLHRLVDSGSSLRCGRNDDFWIRNRSLLREHSI